MHRDFLQELAEVFRRGMRSKRFRKIADPHHLAVALEGLTNAFLYLWLEDSRRHPFPEDQDAILDILFKGLPA